MRATVIMVVSASRHSAQVTAGGTYSQTTTDQGRRPATHFTRGRIAIPVGWPQANGSWQKGHGRTSLHGLLAQPIAESRLQQAEDDDLNSLCRAANNTS